MRVLSNVKIYSVVALVAMLQSTPLCAQMAVANYSTATNDRFENDPMSFFANAQDFSGVGRNATGRWATLVSNNVFLSASHAKPNTGDTLVFHHTNDPNGATTSRVIAGGYAISGSDIWIGWLNSPVGSAVAHYDVPNQPAADLASFATKDTAMATILTVGRSPAGNKDGVSQTNFVVGQNVVDGFETNVTTGGYTTDVIQWVQDEPTDPDVVLYESKLNTGDSGGPSFLVRGPGDMDLVGIHFSINDVFKSGLPREASRDTYVPNFYKAISDEIVFRAPVPEPSSVMMAMLGLLLVARRVRS